MGKKILIIATILLFAFLSSCDDDSTNSSEELGTQQEFAEMLGAANSNFEKIAGSAPESSTDENSPELTFLESSISGSLKNKDANKLMSPVKIECFSGQTFNLSIKINNINPLSKDNIEIVCDVNSESYNAGSHYVINKPYTLSEDELTISFKTSEEMKSGDFFIRVGVKDLTKNLMSNYLSFEIQVNKVSSNTFRSALKFNGVDSYISFDMNSSFDKIVGALKPFTFEFLINFESVNSNMDVFEKADQFFCMLNDKKIAFFKTTGSYNCGVGSPDDFEAGKTYHVAFVYDGATNLICFVNGKKKFVSQCANMILESDSELKIGADYYSNRSIYATIDEFRISNKARYSKEFSKPKKPFKNDNNTIALWHFDEAGGMDITDASGNNNNGRLKGNNKPIWTMIGE